MMSSEAESNRAYEQAYPLIDNYFPKIIFVEPVKAPNSNSDGLYIVGPNTTDALTMHIKRLQKKLEYSTYMLDAETGWDNKDTAHYRQTEKQHQLDQAELTAVLIRAELLVD